MHCQYQFIAIEFLRKRNNNIKLTVRIDATGSVVKKPSSHVQKPDNVLCNDSYMFFVESTDHRIGDNKKST